MPAAGDGVGSEGAVHDPILQSAAAGALDRLSGQDAPRRLAPATIQDYRRQLIAFATWLKDTLDVPFAPDCITIYRVEQYAAMLERQVTRKTRKAAS